MSEKKEKKGLNLIDFFMLGFGAIVGVGWAVASNGWMASGGGPIPAVIGFLFMTIVLIPIGFCYAEMTCAMPVAGGVVAYSYKAFGTFPSFLGGWCLTIAYVLLVPWEAIYVNNTLSLVIPAMTAGEPMYVIAGESIYLPGVAVATVIGIIIIFVNWRGAKVAGTVQTFLGYTLAIVGFTVIIVALLNFDANNIQPIYDNVGKGTHKSLFGGIVAMMIVVPFFMGGFDTIPQGAEEADSGLNYTNLGKVIVMALLSAGLFYSLILFSTGAALPWQEYSQYPRPAISLMFIELYGNGVFGTAMFWIAWSGALAGLLTTWNGFYIASARLLLGMSRARLIPEFFSKIHPKYGTPMGGNAFLAFVCLIGPFIGMGIIDPITSAGGVGFCVGWFITSASALKLRIVEPDMVRPYKAPGGKPLMAIATVLAGIVIIISFIPGLPSFMGPLATSIFFGWTALGLILYFASTGYRKAISEEERVKVMFASTKDIDLEQFDQQ